jgi:nucleoside-diphosphate-sugar epimerase
MKRLLVTGTGGALGRALLSLLQKDYKKYKLFVATTNEGRFTEHDNVVPIQVDLLKSSERKSLFKETKPDMLVHLAWNIKEESFWHGSSNLEWLTASLDILHLFAQNGGKKMLFAGSSAEYELHCGGMAEEEGGRSRTLYGASKLAFANVSMLYGRQVDLQVVIARYFAVYGEHDARPGRAMPTAFRRFLCGKQVVCNSPCAIRDYIYALDAAQATVALLDSNFTGIVNIASGEPRTMREVFTTIAEEMGCLELLSFDENTATKDVLVADTSKLNNEIGFKCKTDFRGGIRRCIEWWRNNGERNVEI